MCLKLSQKNIYNNGQKMKGIEKETSKHSYGNIIFKELSINFHSNYESQ